MKREDCANWIRKVRGKMSREEFGKRVYHYTGNDMSCATYHRNAVGSWETKGNIPKNVETFLSIALIEYDREHPEACADCRERNRRYEYARQILYDILGVDFYCRSLHDALLIQVCRGILSFEEVPKLERQLEPSLQECKEILGAEEKREYALQRATQLIENDWYEIMDKEEIPHIVEKNQVSFSTWDRTMGERILSLYKSRERYQKTLSLDAAVHIYAPNCRKSYLQKFIHSSGTTRQWLLDLCVHLRFNRGEIQEVLEYAHMAPLSEDSEDPEFYLREEPEMPIGSAAWYRKFELPKSTQTSEKSTEALCHFRELEGFRLYEKLQALTLMVCCIEEYSVQELPPIDYLLESFTLYRSGKRKGRGDEMIRKLEELLEKAEAEGWESEELQTHLKTSIEDWSDYIQSGYAFALEESELDIYRDYQQECHEYYTVPKERLTHVKDREGLCKLRYIAGLFYTVFTGQYYQGRLSSDTLEQIKSQFQSADPELEDLYQYVYRFISYVLGIFLSQAPIYENENSAFYILEENKEGEILRKSKSMDLYEIIEDLWGALRELKCTK